MPLNPFEMGSFAFEKWQEITTGLCEKGIIDKIDAAHIQGLCRSWQTAVEADRLIDERGIVVDTEHGPRKNPAVNISKDAWLMVRQFSGDLGLYHLSRQRLIATPMQDDPPKRMRRDRNAGTIPTAAEIEDRYLS